MSRLKAEQQEIKSLVEKVAIGDCQAYQQLEGLVKPLMTSLSDYFSSLHHKFEFEDFYAICMNALYEACLEYNPRNPSFFSYAKTFMYHQCCRELEYWNANMRNIFEYTEISCDMKLQDSENDGTIAPIQLREERQTEEIVEQSEFRRHVAEIISNLFDNEKATILNLYIIEDMSPIDISKKTGINYQNTYTTIRRGMKKITKEYQLRYILDK